MTKIRRIEKQRWDTGGFKQLKDGSEEYKKDGDNVKVEQ